MWLTYPLSYDLTGSIISTSSYKSRLSNWYTCITRSVTLSPPSLALSLKILPIFRLSTRGAVFSYSICCHLSLMPSSEASIYYAALIALILFISEVIPSCSYYIKKGLVYVTIAALFGHQPLSYAECIKVNICLSYNICSVSSTKCIYCPTLLSCLVLYLNYYKVLDLIHH